MISLDLGDPTLLSVGVVQTQNIPQATVRLAVWNDSPCVLLIQFPDRFQRIPSGTARLFEIEAGQVQLQWSVETGIQTGTAPYSKVTWECYKLQDPIPETYPIQIIRQQAVTGALSVSTVVAGVRGVAYPSGSAGTLINLLTYSVPGGAASPIFRVNAVLLIGKGGTTGSNTPNLQAQYVDPNVGGTVSVPLMSQVGGWGAAQLLQAVNSFSLNVSGETLVQIIPLVIHASAGGTITIQYSDQGSTVNDFISVAIEQVF